MDGEEAANVGSSHPALDMAWTSALAIYILFWSISLFFILPLGVRTADELGQDKVTGQAESAPANFDGRKIMLRTTLLSTGLFALFYLNYRFGWLTMDAISFIRPPANFK